MTKRDGQLFLGNLGFFRNDDGTTVVETAIRTGPVLKLLLVAIGAFGSRWHSCFVMGAAFTPACL
jgi:hypothetical protein